MRVLRTPDDRFGDRPDFPCEPRYTEVPDGYGGTLRIHHIDEGPADGPIVLCMHGQPTWSFLYRKMVPTLVNAGLRVVAPDLVGFGRSDKPAAREDFSYNAQVAWMKAWLIANDFRGITFVGQDWGGLIGLRLVAENPERFDRVVISNTGLPVPRALPQDRIDAVKDFRANAPTPSMSEMGKALSGRLSVPNELRFAYGQKWAWETPDIPVAMIIAGTMRDAPLSPRELAAYDAPFRENVPGAAGQPHTTIEGGGHFLQETRADDFVKVIIDAIQPSNQQGVLP